jgi:hypothetical protein
MKNKYNLVYYCSKCKKYFKCSKDLAIHESKFHKNKLSFEIESEVNGDEQQWEL